jgi:hypothetical protein
MWSCSSGGARPSAHDRAANQTAPSSRHQVMKVARATSLLSCLLLLFAGCAAPPPSPSIRPTVAATPELDLATSAAVRFRTSFGLRSDLDFIRAVAKDPAASDEFGVPLLPAEVAEINRRGANADRVGPIVRAYAAEHPAAFGGMWIDQEHGGLVTVAFTEDADLHGRELATRLAGVGVVAIRSARYSERELRALQDRIVADDPWFKTIPAQLRGVGVDVTKNAVEIDISTANPSITELIVARFGIPADAIVVNSDGSGVALEPWGTIRGKIVDVPPKVFPDLTLQYTSDRAGAECGMGDVGIGPGADGTFELPCQGGHWTIQAGRTIDDIVAEGVVDLAPGGRASVVLRPIASR